MASVGGAQKERRLQQLQEELLQLKQGVPGLHLRRSTAAQSPAAPFPITASAPVAAPPAAERYDVAGFNLSVRLGPGVLSDSGGELVAAVEAAVEGAELPRALRLAMSAELHRAWAATAPAPGALNLAQLWALASQRFVHLVTLLPEVLETYQCEDASGSTVRRWAVLSDEATLTIDATPRPAAPPARPPEAAAAARAAGSPGKPSAGHAAKAAAAAGPPPRQHLQGGTAEAAAGLPRGLQQELTFLQRRYGLRMLPAPLGEAAAAGAAAQLASMQLGVGSGSSGGGSTAAGEAAAAEAAAPAAPVAAAAFEVAIVPSDPAWAPATHPPCLHLQGWAAASYPAPGSLALAVSPAQAVLPALHREVLGKLLAAEVAAAVAAAAAAPRPAPLSSAIRHVANHAGELWQQAEDIAVEVARRRQQQQEQQQQQQQDGAAGAQHSSRPAGGGSSGAASSSELDDDGAWGGSYASSSSSGAGSDGEGSPAAAEGRDARGGGGGGHSEAQLPLALQLEGLELEVDCLEALKLMLQVACSRCRVPAELTFASAAVALPADAAAGRRGTLAAAAECGKCHAQLRAELAPKLVHGYSNTLAHVRCEGCAPVDLLPSMLAGQCPQCSGSAAFRGVAVGRWNERQCTACHTPMRFQFSSALFVPLRRPSGQRGGAARGGAPQQAAGPRSHGGGALAPAAGEFNGLLTPGQPLPDRGACRHYRHSYRWLRFPCCGKRFPCDLCHEELTDGHDMKWATRMVCGYCSVEQPVAPECKACGKKLAASASAPTGRQSRFWEGGKGQRDPSKLHPNDPRRHRGRFKTKSAKHKRVGQKGKEK